MNSDGHRAAMDYRAAAMSGGMHLALLLLLMAPRGLSSVETQSEGKSAPADRRVVFIEAHELGTGTCDYSYIGLGILHGSGGELWEVAPGSPAARAGLLPGDFLVNAGELSFNGLPDGTPVVLRYRRAGVTREITVRVGPVCYGG